MKIPGHISIAQALERLEAADGKRSIALFEHGTLIVKMYAPRAIDAQQPHTQDEIYVVAAGSGKFDLNGSRELCEIGDVLFALAGTSHKFVDFTGDFAVWVFFYGPEGGER
jgi:mannose-6-phosphate isomerase-like protein (cupin superfamily)